MRMVFMAYLTGSVEAVDFYCKAFNTENKKCFKAADEDDFYAHAEIIINNRTVLALSESNDKDRGNNMEFWLTFDDEESLKTAYDALREGANIHQALAPCEWSKSMAALTDKYGINWLLNVF